MLLGWLGMKWRSRVLVVPVDPRHPFVRVIAAMWCQLVGHDTWEIVEVRPGVDVARCERCGATTGPVALERDRSPRRPR